MIFIELLSKTIKFSVQEVILNCKLKYPPPSKNYCDKSTVKTPNMRSTVTMRAVKIKIKKWWAPNSIKLSFKNYTVKNFILNCIFSQFQKHILRPERCTHENAHLISCFICEVKTLLCGVCTNAWMRMSAMPINSPLLDVIDPPLG